MRSPLRILLAVTLLVLAGCAGSPKPSMNQARPLTVAAAADLQLAFSDIAKLFEARTGQKVFFSFGSTGTLAAQIEQGAPFDLFAAANIEFVDRLAGKGLLTADTQQLYATGRIVLASSKTAGVELQGLADLLDPRITKVAIANPDHAPYGLAAKQALISAGLWEKVQPKLVFGENVRQALQYVETGNAEAGIVALSIADSPKISYRLIDDRLHSPLKQALAVVKDTPYEKVARDFITFVNGPEGRPIMKKYGFVLPGELDGK